MFERTKNNALPYPKNLISAMGFDENEDIDIDELYDIVKFKTTPPNKELLTEYFKDNMKMADMGKLHNLSTERIRQKIKLSMWDIKRYIIKTKISKEITWHTYEYRTKICCATESVTVDAPYMIAETPIGIFAILPIYSSHARIKHFSIWHQTPDMKSKYGENYGIEIKMCSDFEDGQRIIENFYIRIKKNNEYKNYKPQNLDPNIPIPNPFNT